jgi:hypothetical protein
LSSIFLNKFCAAYTRKMDAQFRQRGFILLRPDWLLSNLSQVQREFRDTLRNFPDFAFEGAWGVRQDGILTNPGSFHNLLSRGLRQCATLSIAPIITDILRTHPEFKMQCAVSPMAFSPDARKSKDGARWDFVRKPLQHDMTVLEGFINIGPTTQIFTCAPGTHLCKGPQNKPIEVFRLLHASREKDIPKAADCGSALDCNGKTVKIRVPPGTLVVYDNTLLVKLETARAAGESTQHLRWTFADSFLADHSALNLTQPFYWMSYTPVYFRPSKKEKALERLAAFSRGFKDKNWLTHEKYGGKISAAEVDDMGGRVPPLITHSLRTLPRSYPDYHQEELKLYAPSRGPWVLGDDALCGQGQIAVQYSARRETPRRMFDDEMRLDQLAVKHEIPYEIPDEMPHEIQPTRPEFIARPEDSEEEELEVEAPAAPVRKRRIAIARRPTRRT